MDVVFKRKYLQELYTQGVCGDKHHRYQPQIIRKYKRIIDLMKVELNVLGLAKYGSLHYEHLHGDKEGVSSVRLNDQFRIEFVEERKNDELIATILNITELSNHYN